MKVAIIGASGFIGSALRAESLARGHAVTALVTRPDRLAPEPRLTALKADVPDADALAGQLRGHDAVLSAFSGHAQADVRDYYRQGIRSIVRAVQAAGVPRLLVVGGAGSLETEPGRLLIDSPDFPAQWKASAEGARHALELLRGLEDLDWTMLSPAASIAPGRRTGTFRLGRDRLLTDAAGNSAISLEDYAVAMLDELERPAHRRQRFTVAY